MAVIYEVTYADGRKVQAVATPRVEVAVEQDHYQLREGRWLQWIYRLSWQALTFDGQETRNFEDFLADTTDISPVPEAADAADPTRLVQLPNGSSPSVLQPAVTSPGSSDSPGE